ncbi:AraC family transcriptional regulator [Thiocapsa bogorovii]|uniref:AraC family transcriptional regulator n=1 Tax=Thiocapsa bogorovii TaxID=521689 RepID=UPI001E5B2BD6|nr:AraC family transcriptional regulator [Thiocapsa bogorovii]UHD17245.1 AraC family transcriptional regulator [Thiocapsa bogorovii]
MTLSRLPPAALAQLAAVTDGHFRAGPLLGIPQLLRSMGQDPDAVIHASGLDPRFLDDPETTIDFHAGGRLLAHCAAITDCPHFGLLLGHTSGLHSIGVIGVLVRHSPDTERALHNLVLHLLLHDRGAVPSLTVEGALVLLGYAIYQPGVEGTRQIYDLAIATARNILKTLRGSDWRPSEVLLPHRAPPDVKPYLRFFESAVRFDAERAALVFSSDCFARPVSGADPRLYEVARERVAALEASASCDILARIRPVLRNLLLSGEASIGEVAGVFELHKRTLNRRMRECGLTFRELVEEVRYDLARQLLRETDLQVVSIAEVLDYADAAAFTRAFRRWSGTTPAAWRKNQSHG